MLGQSDIWPGRPTCLTGVVPFASGGELVGGSIRRGNASPGSAAAGCRSAIRRIRCAVHDRPRVRAARDASELARFADGYGSVSGYHVDPAYLARAQVFIAVRARQVVGGFAINVEPPFRTMTRLPESERRRLAPSFPAGDTVELTCAWLAPHARGRIGSAALWGNLVWHAARQHRTRVVFGTEVDRLRRLYELTQPRLLYEGPVRVDGHLRHGWVYSISARRWPLVLLRVVSWKWTRRPRT
jgi:hypothetical protein